MLFRSTFSSVALSLVVLPLLFLIAPPSSGANDKDYKPQWKPARIEDVKLAMTDAFFASPWGTLKTCSTSRSSIPCGLLVGRGCFGETWQLGGVGTGVVAVGGGIESGIRN